MTVQNVGNLRVPIGTETKNNCTGTKKIRELDWSVNEDGIDERSKSLMYPKQQALHHPS